MVSKIRGWPVHAGVLVLTLTGLGAGGVRAGETDGVAPAWPPVGQAAPLVAVPLVPDALPIGSAAAVGVAGLAADRGDAPAMVVARSVGSQTASATPAAAPKAPAGDAASGTAAVVKATPAATVAAAGAGAPPASAGTAGDPSMERLAERISAVLAKPRGRVRVPGAMGVGEVIVKVKAPPSPPPAVRKAAAGREHGDAEGSREPDLAAGGREASTAAGHGRPALAAVQPQASGHGHGHASGAGHPHWSYDGETGPEHWARLSPEFATCARGERQSPIDIRDGLKLDLDPVRFDYRPGPFTVLDNGHTIQVSPGAGNAIEAQGRRWTLQQFHFHRPAEERIDGRTFEMSVHFVHRDAEGRLAVVAVLVEAGAPHAGLQAVLNNVPLERNDAMAVAAPLDPGLWLPSQPGHYVFMGSLTTPPCTEGVLWIVMKQPLQASPAQLALFARLYPMNARPLQALGDRRIKESD